MPRCLLMVLSVISRRPSNSVASRSEADIERLSVRTEPVAFGPIASSTTPSRSARGGVRLGKTVCPLAERPARQRNRHTGERDHCGRGLATGAPVVHRRETSPGRDCVSLLDWTGSHWPRDFEANPQPASSIRSSYLPDPLSPRCYFPYADSQVAACDDARE